MTAGFRIVSWNLLHSTGARLQDVKNLIAAKQPDLLLMQEATAIIDALPQALGGHYARIVLPGRLHGLAAWSPLPFHSPARSLTLQPGLLVKRVCQLLDFTGFTIANVHLSHGQVLNRRQLRRIAAALPARAAILGDCNMLGAPLLPGFKDAGARHPTHRMNDVIPLRLDRCFVRGLTCTASEVLAAGASDHHPLLVVLAPI